MSEELEEVDLDVDDVIDDLYDQYRSVGLFPDLDLETFADIVDVRCGDAVEDWVQMLNEMMMEDHPASLQLLRHYTVAMIQGIVNDWKFGSRDILAQAQRALKAAGVTVSLSCGQEKFDEQTRTVELRLDSHPPLNWRCHSLPGFVAGINMLLKQGGIALQFLALDSKSDQYQFVCVTEEVASRIGQSLLFQLLKETDRLAGPA